MISNDLVTEQLKIIDIDNVDSKEYVTNESSTETNDYISKKDIE